MNFARGSICRRVGRIAVAHGLAYLLLCSWTLTHSLALLVARIAICIGRLCRCGRFASFAGYSHAIVCAGWPRELGLGGGRYRIRGSTHMWQADYRINQWMFLRFLRAWGIFGGFGEERVGEWGADVFSCGKVATGEVGSLHCCCCKRYGAVVMNECIRDTFPASLFSTS